MQKRDLHDAYFAETTAFFYEYDKPALELDGENNENARNVYGTSLVSRNSLNYLYNGHGDTTAVINGNTVVTEYEYDAFGNGMNFADDDTNPFRYCGEYYDTEVSVLCVDNAKIVSHGIKAVGVIFMPIVYIFQLYNSSLTNIVPSRLIFTYAPG